MTNSLPLAGVQVVDLGQWMAGPTAARLLADNGADVVHVDPPGGPRWSAEADAVLNRGKHRVQIDLEDPAGLAEAHRLTAGCDVLVQNFRPGALDRFGLGPAAVRSRHPGVVYLSLPGFASSDDEHAGVDAYEGVIASATGQFSDMGVNRVLMGIGASFSPLPLGSAYAGVFGAMAVALALRARLRHGQGDHVEVPVAASLLEALAYNSMHVEDLPPRYLSLREEAIAGFRERGQHPDLGYEQLQDLLDPFYRSYPCADGRLLYLVAVSHRRHPHAVLEVLGLLDEAVRAGLPMHDPYLPTSQWPAGAESTLRAHPIREPWATWLSTRIAAVLATRTSRDWEELLAERGIPAVGHRTTAEWLRVDHALDSGLLVDVVDPHLGRTRQPGPVLWLEEVPAGPEPTGSQDSPPAESSAESPAESPAPSPGAGWLEGVTVVDLTNVIAGPTIGSTLARFGARVIKVDLPEPTFDPWSTVLCGLHANRGKESVLLDIRHDLARPALLRLLQQADVVTVNGSERQLAALGLTGADLARVAPHAVLCHLDAWGGSAGAGPWSQRSGYDDLVQAATGIMARFGGGLDTPEEHAHFGTIDVLAGLSAATAAALALYARDASGVVSVARTSLAAAGQLVQAPYLCAHDGPSLPEPSGRAVRGEGPTYRLYDVADGWAFVVVPPAAMGALGAALGLVGLDELGAADLGDAVAERLRQHPGRHWRDTLGPVGVTVQPLATLTGLREQHTGVDQQPWASSSFHFTTAERHQAGRAVTLVAPIAIRPEQARIRVPADAPTYGEHTVAVLTELGCTQAEIDAMVRAGAAGLAWSTEYLPS